MENLLYISSLNREFAKALLSRFHQNATLRREAYAFCYRILEQPPNAGNNIAEFIQTWDRAAQVVNQERTVVVDQLKFLGSVTANFDSLADQKKRLSELADKVRGALDKQRIRQVATVLEYLVEYSQQRLYSEQERLAIMIKTKVAELLNDIESSPTKLSLDILRAYLLTLQRTIDDHFAGIERERSPQPDRYAILHSYVVTDHGLIECEIEVSNEAGKSPASAVKIIVGASPTDEYRPQQREIIASQALVGGQTAGCVVPVIVTEKAKAANVFTLYLHLAYSTRLNHEIEIGPLAIPIRLDKIDFRHVTNPYAPWVQSGAVTEEHMFYGRNEFIGSLLDMIKTGPVNKSVVVYGQKRQGSPPSFTI